MPNRIIKESIFTSDKVSQMTDFQFRLWVNLIAYVDDYGRGDARAAVIKGRCFPLREEVKISDITSALSALESIGCIHVYSVNGKNYFYFPTWETHQRIQTKRSKFPSPEEADQQNSVSHGEPPWVTASHCDPPLESNPIQSESKFKYESESKGESKPKACPSEHSDVFEMFSAGDEVLLLALKDFDKMRTRIKKPMTDKARELLTRKLQEFKREEWVDVLNQSVYQGWAGIYPINTDKEKKRGKKVVTFMDV